MNEIVYQWTYKQRLYIIHLDPVVQSNVSLMNLLRGQLVKCFRTLLPNITIFFVEKM